MSAGLLPRDRWFSAKPSTPSWRCSPRPTCFGFMQRRLLAEPFARDFRQAIPVAEPMPSVTAGMITRADNPLTRTGVGNGQGHHRGRAAPRPPGLIFVLAGAGMSRNIAVDRILVNLKAPGERDG